MMTGTGCHMFEWLEALRIDHRHPGLLGCPGIVAHPQQALVRLQSHPHRIAARRDRVNQLELLAVDDRHRIGIGHGNKHPFVVCGCDPVHGRLFQFDAR